jgi:hypothetical protein
MWQAHILAFIAVLPFFFIWFMAFYCYGLLQRYATSIGNSREGPAFKRIANGVALLSWGLVIQAFTALLMGALANHTSSLRSLSLYIEEYSTLLFPLIALPLIGSGTHKLLRLKRTNPDLPTNYILRFLFAALAVIYTYLILHLNHHGHRAYGLPPFWLLTTVAVPYLFAWFSGLSAAFEISIHAQVTDGVLYRRALNLLATGLIIFILSSILAQYLGSAYTAQAGQFSINAVLLFDYLLLAGIGLGYAIMLSGVQRLQRIEEI